jgi:hypothetical protein
MHRNFARKPKSVEIWGRFQHQLPFRKDGKCHILWLSSRKRFVFILEPDSLRLEPFLKGAQSSVDNSFLLELVSPACDSYYGCD